jgi:hypothetical protein
MIFPSTGGMLPVLLQSGGGGGGQNLQYNLKKFSNKNFKLKIFNN